MIKRLLIANRGEIAVRIIRACRELGIEAIVPYSESDAESLPVAMADRAVCIGPAGPARRSYLDIPSVLAAAEGTGADAVHPGYGFLAENPDFATACADHGITFVGPPARAIALMGDKIAARKTVAGAGVPVVPGTEDPVADAAQARSLAQDIGPPVLLKAKAGGGGRGMRIIRKLADVGPAFEAASREAAAAFGDGALYIERYLERVRHVEFQILADTRGNTVSLGERDC
jgi:acetyl-CoA carboxylase biotin carboxylase subunit